MISFENITKRNFKYELMYKYVRFAHNLIFYRKFQIENRKNIPQGKPVVAICNHQNGLSDALGILFAFSKDGRRPVFIARADIFRKELWAKLLRFLRIMPAFRKQDMWAGSGDVSENEKVFNVAADILVEENNVVCLFPEAGHQDRHTLGTFKKGFARIAFKAAERADFKKPIYILPMGNHYSNYFSFQSDLLINIGEPFEFSDLYEIYKEHPERAQKLLADRARPKVEELMLNIKDTEHYDEYYMLSDVYVREQIRHDGGNVEDFQTQFLAKKKIVAAVESLEEQNPEKFQELMKKSYRYVRLLEKLHLRDWIFRNKISFGGTMLRLLLGILILPLVLFGFVVNFIPFNASTLITRKIKDQMLHSSFHFAMGALVAFPLWYLICFLVLLIFVEWWVALIYIAMLPLSLIIYFKGKVLWLKLYNRLRRFQLWFKGNRFFREATELREALVKDMDDIMQNKK